LFFGRLEGEKGKQCAGFFHHQAVRRGYFAKSRKKASSE